MNAEQFAHALDQLGLSSSDFGALTGVTSRAVNLWLSGQRAIPGPTIAYVGLLQSLPKVLQIQELSRLTKEAPMPYDGMYEIEYLGRVGSGICTLVLMDGCAFGYDNGNGRYDGTYEPNSRDRSRLDLKINVIVPPGTVLVTGVPAQPVEYRFPLTATIPARGTSEQTVTTPFGPVQCAIRFIRPLPAELAA